MSDTKDKASHHHGNLRQALIEAGIELLTEGGLDALTHAMAVSLGPKIRVNAIRPGWIETRNWQKQANREQVEHREQDKAQHPVGRVGNPEDIAQTVDWLIGAGFVTGQAINVDGGMTVKMIYEH